MRGLMGAAAVALLASVVVTGQERSVGDADIMRASVTIVGIDPARRMVTFRDDKGLGDTVHLGPEVKRFDELKVGDRVNLTYYQSRIFDLKKRGTATGPVGTTGTEIVRGEGPTPSAAAGRQVTMVVTVISTDLANGIIGVRTDDGNVFRKQLQDKSLLEGVVADDKIEITFTNAILVEVERP